MGETQQLAAPRPATERDGRCKPVFHAKSIYDPSQPFQLNVLDVSDQGLIDRPEVQVFYRIGTVHASGPWSPTGGLFRPHVAF